MKLAYSLFFLSMIFVSVGDILAKLWTKTNVLSHFWLAILCYASCSFCWMWLLKEKGLIVATVAWAVMSIIASVTIAVVLYHETLTVVKIIGVALGLASVAILNLSAH